MTCENCGKTMILIVSKGDYVKLKCADCGSIWQGTVSWVDLLPSRQPHCTVVVRWGAERATWKEIAALRQVFPELKNEPVQHLRSRIGGRPEWIAGDFLEIVGQRLRREANNLGLNVMVRPTAAES